MSRPCLLALSLLPSLAACGAPVVQPLAEAKRLEPDDTKPSAKTTTPKATETPTPTPTPTPPPEPPATAYLKPGNPVTQHDELRFHGWSPDSQRFAFETFDHGPSATRCEGLASLYVVDVATNTFVDGSPLELRHREPEPDDGRCDPPDLRAEMDRHRPEVLHRHGIVVGNQGPPIIPTLEINTRGVAKVARIDLAEGRSLRSELQVLHGGRDKVSKQGAAYKLTLFGPTPAPLVVEPGQRRRPFIWDYSVDEGLVFLAPNAQHLALLVATTRLSFEGDRHSFMGHGVVLPEGW